MKYGAESLTITHEMACINGVGKEVLGRIQGQTQNGCRRIKTNKEMYYKYKSPDIVIVLKVGRLE